MKPVPDATAIAWRCIRTYERAGQTRLHVIAIGHLLPLATIAAAINPGDGHIYLEPAGGAQ